MKTGITKKICVVSPSLKMGGIERALVVLANYFVNNNMQVTFVSCLKGTHFYSLDNRIEIIEPNFENFGNFFGKIIFYPRLIAFLRIKIKKIKPDIVLVFGDIFSPIVLLALLRSGFSVVISDRTSPDYKFKFPLNFLKKWLYPNSAGFVAQTRRSANFKKNQFGEKLNIKIIPNALRDVKLYPEVQREKIILYVGRFSWEKGIERLIKSFACIENKNGWKLHLAGSGPLLENLKILASDLDVRDDLSFLGNVENVDLLFARSSIFVLPSFVEGFPNSLCEAMAAGLPVICFDSIPYEDILVPGETGIVIKNGGETDLSKIISGLMNDKEERLRLGKNAQVVVKRLSANFIGKQMLNFILKK